MGLFLDLLKNPQRLSRLPELKYWLIILVLIVLIYTLFSSGDFSFLLTLSSLLSCLSFLGIFLQVQISDTGLSRTTFILYSLVYSFRLCSILAYESYLPNDSTGDWLYQAIEIFSLFQSVILANKVKSHKENPLWLGIVPVVIVISSIVHPTLNKNVLTDTCWMISMVLETFSLVPLIWKIKQLNDFENFSSHFVAAHSVGNILSFVFWLDTYKELNRSYAKTYVLNHYSGYLLIISQIGTLLFTGQFLWYYVKSAIYGTPFVLPI